VDGTPYYTVAGKQHNGVVAVGMQESVSGVPKDNPLPDIEVPSWGSSQHSGICDLLVFYPAENSYDLNDGPVNTTIKPGVVTAPSISISSNSVVDWFQIGHPDDEEQIVSITNTLCQEVFQTIITGVLHLNKNQLPGPGAYVVRFGQAFGKSIIN